MLRFLAAPSRCATPSTRPWWRTRPATLLATGADTLVSADWEVPLLNIKGSLAYQGRILPPPPGELPARPQPPDSGK